MRRVVSQEEDKIEIALWDELTEGEFLQVVHQLESLCAMYPEISVLFDASHLEKYELKVILEEYDFYKNYRHHLKRVALVSDDLFQAALLKLFNKFTETEFRTFEGHQIEAARGWIFRSKQPAAS